MFPLRSRLKTTVISSGSAFDAGGGRQQLCSRSYSCWRVSTRLGSVGGSLRSSPGTPFRTRPGPLQRTKKDKTTTAARLRTRLSAGGAAPPWLLDIGGDLHLHHLVGIG